MGITGLIPYLEKASSKINIKGLSGKTVAIDTYCWLHRGAFGCAEKLSRGEETTVHIQYCLKYVNLFLSHNIKPILVFDGRHLPAKAQTELKRRESRKAAKKRALELLRLGKAREARSYLQRCVDITHEMALQLIQECRKMNVDCVVAPYEADAQMAYLNKINVAQYVVTEDSDLVLFGCSNILFKLDLTGQCLLVEADKLHLAMGCKLEKYTFDKFRSMCILSGCDYLDSLPGIGLAKACKFILLTEETDMRRALRKIPNYLNMRNLEVTEEYIEGFLKADATFKHMFVYDPLKRTMVRLYELEEYGTAVQYCSNAGELLDDATAFQLALGNIDPFTLKTLDNWNPDIQRTVTQTRSKKNICAKHKSIWQNDFSSQNYKRKTATSTCAIQFKKMEYRITATSDECEPTTECKSETDILSLYSRGEPPSKRQCLSEESDEEEISKHVVEALIHHTPSRNTHNPFIKTTPDFASPTKLDKSNTSLLKLVSPIRKELSIDQKVALQKLSKFERTSIDPSKKVLSRFFSSNVQKARESGKLDTSQESCDDSKSVEKIMEEARLSQEKQALDAASLYLASPQAKASSRGDVTPPRCTSPVNDTTPLRAITPPGENKQFKAVLTSLDSGISMCSSELEKIDEGNEDESTNVLSKFEFKKTRLTTEASNSQKENEITDIVELSSDDEKDKKKLKTTTVKKSTKKATRRIGLPKSKSDGVQSKLSMFGFQKRSSMTQSQ